MVHRRIWLGIVVPLLLALLTSLAVYQIITANSRTLQRVSDSSSVAGDLNALIKTVIDAETGERGFILTGDEAFLEPYTASTPDFGVVLARLRRQLPGPENAARFAEVDAAFERWHREVAEVAIRARRDAPVGLASALQAAKEAFDAAHTAALQFELSGDQAQLNRARAALSDVREQLTRVQELEQQPTQTAEVRRAAELVERYEAQFGGGPGGEAGDPALLLSNTLSRLVQEANASEARTVRIVRSGAGKALTDRIRLLVADIAQGAEAELEQTLSSSALSNQRAQTVAFAGPLFAAVVSLIAVLQTQRCLNRSVYKLTAVAKDVAEGQLDKRLTLPRGDELAGLASDFNRMADRLSKREQQTLLLSQMSSALQTCATQAEAYRVTERYVPTLFEGFAGTLYIVSDSRNLMERVASWNETDTAPQTYAPTDCWALRRGRTHHVGARAADMPCAHAPTPAPSESLCLPLISQDETLGVLYLYAPALPDEGSAGVNALASESVDRFSSTVTEQLALALSNLRLRESLRHQSVRDPLTGLFNRRHLEETLALELHRAERRQEPLSLVMFDVDHFKNYNDTYGHDAGDAVLRAVSALAARHIRAGDLACRYGGEEFLLVQPGLAAEHACARAESFREAVKRLSLEHAGRALGHISVSLGIATYPDHALKAEDLIKHADEALYRAKRSGRDRTVIAGDSSSDRATASRPPALPSAANEPRCGSDGRLKTVDKTR